MSGTDAIAGILADAGLPPGILGPADREALALVERYTGRLALGLVRDLVDPAALARGDTVDAIVTSHGFVPAFRPALAWLLARLGADGIDLRAPLPAPDAAPERAACLARAPSFAPAFQLLDEAAALYPRVARGETSGERALFLKASLWVAYFSNANGAYALNNRIAAHAAANRLTTVAAARVLEVGAGLGSATEALLEALAARDGLARLAAYDATEPVAFFRRRAARTLVAAHPAVPLAFGALDVSAPWGGQGIAPASRDLVWGVNVFHLARDLGATLRDAWTALAPGGWLVVGEALRPFPNASIGAELPFQILDSFRAVETDPVVRPTPGFLTPEGWTTALARAGFTDVGIVPDVARLRAHWQGSFTGAVCGRRPAP